MKLSYIIKPITQVIFWIAFILAALWMFNIEGNILLSCLLMSACVIYGCITRIIKMELIRWCFHIGMFVFPALAYMVGNQNWFLTIILILYVVLSIITRLSKSDMLNKANTFQLVVFVLIYLLLCLLGYEHIIVIYGLLFAYSIFYLLQNSVISNENYIEEIGQYKTKENKHTYATANYITIIAGLIIALVGLAVSMLGKLRPFAFVSDNINRKALSAFNFIRRIILTEKEPYVPKDPNYNPYNPNMQQGMVDNTDYSKAVHIPPFVIVLLIIALLIVAIYFIYRIYKGILKIKSEDNETEELSLTATHEKKEPKEDTRKTDPTYSNRKTVRRMYRKKVKGRAKGRRDDLKTRTPYEQKDKCLENGQNVTNEFVDIYEKARYSKKKISKSDIKHMQDNE